MTINIKNLDRICLIIVALVSLLSAYWVVNYRAKQKKEFREEEAVSSKRARDLSLAEKNLKHLRKLLDTKKEGLTSLNERIPGPAGIGTFLKQVDTLVRARDVALVSINPQPPLKENHFTRIPIGLVLKGPFVKLYHLVRDLESMKRAVVMEKMTIARSDKAQECLAKLTVNIFER